MNDLFVYEFGFLKRKEEGVKRYTLLQDTFGKVSTRACVIVFVLY